MTSSTPAVLPLTTVFVPPASCVDYAELVPLSTSAGTAVLYYHLGSFNDTACMPSGWSPSSYFSPGQCSSGYTVATSAISITNDSVTETAGYCCPTGYSHPAMWTDEPIFSTERCYSTPYINPPLSTLEAAHGSTWIDDSIVAYAVSIRWTSGDFSTAPADPRKRVLSPTARAGIGFGVTFGVFTIMTMGAVILLSRRKRRQQRVPADASIKSSNYEKYEVETQSDFQRNYSVRSTWTEIELNSWSFEMIAISFSVSCFIAIFCILQIYNGQPTPQLPKGITLNTIVSILATASKSSLMFATGECIAQLRWVSFRKSRQSLSYVQLYDSASRGPWGSMTILLQDRFRSLVGIGAVIVLLAMAFDPFVQQIIDYPVLPTHRQSKAAKVVQSRYLLPPSYNSKALTDAINGGIWSEPIDPDVSCPTGNCTWPHFRSIEMCSKCVDVDPSNVTLSGWDMSSFNQSLLKEQDMQASISILSGTFSNFSIPVIPSEWPEGMFTAYVPKYLYWVSDASIGRHDPVDPIASQPGIGNLFGFDPLMVIASAELDLPQQFPANDDNLAGTLKVLKATECALSICAREYAISVERGDNSVKILNEDFGTMYTAVSNDSDIDGDLCWKPSSSSMTNWSMHAYNRQWEPDLLDWNLMDLANFEFCDVVPRYYIQEMQALVGTMGWPYQGGDFEEWTNFGEFELEKLTASSSPIRRATYIGLETVMANIASSVSALARRMSNAPIYGVVITQDSYVVVRWQWLTLPAVLLVAGIILLITTALASSRGGVRIWKSSTLPLLFHGLEPEFVTRNMMIEHGQCESASEMEQVADGIKVYLGMSSDGGRTMLREENLRPQNAANAKRISRRRSF